MTQSDSGCFEPTAAHEIPERFACPGVKETVQMKRRESRERCQMLQPQVVGEVGVDMVDDAVESSRMATERGVGAGWACHRE